MRVCIIEWQTFFVYYMRSFIYSLSFNHILDFSHLLVQYEIIHEQFKFVYRQLFVDMIASLSLLSFLLLSSSHFKNHWRYSILSIYTSPTLMDFNSMYTHINCGKIKNNVHTISYFITCVQFSCHLFMRSRPFLLLQLLLLLLLVLLFVVFAVDPKL